MRAMIVRIFAAKSENGRAMESGLWILILQAAAALALLVFIVWWTLPKRDKRDDDRR